MSESTEWTGVPSERAPHAGAPLHLVRIQSSGQQPGPKAVCARSLGLSALALGLSALALGFGALALGLGALALGLGALDEVSDGVILHLALLALVHGPQPPSMLLLEDPESGVHPARLVALCNTLRDWATRTGCQVVLTTHMPYLLDAVQPDEAWFCRRGADGIATVSCFADLADLDRQLRVRSLGEVWSALGEETLFSRMKNVDGV